MIEGQASCLIWPFAFKSMLIKSYSTSIKFYDERIATTNWASLYNDMPVYKGERAWSLPSLLPSFLPTFVLFDGRLDWIAEPIDHRRGRSSEAIHNKPGRLDRERPNERTRTRALQTSDGCMRRAAFNKCGDRRHQAVAKYFPQVTDGRMGSVAYYLRTMSLAA